MTNTLALQEWLEVIRNEYLEGFIKDGGSSIKFTVPMGPGLSELLKQAVASEAESRGYLVVYVDAGETRVHMPQDVFFNIAAQVDWRLLARTVILQLAGGLGYVTNGIDPRQNASVIQAISDASSVEEHIIVLDLRRRLPDAISRNRNMSRDFRLAMTQLCLTEMEPGGQGQESYPLIDWLNGENRRVSSVRPYSIYNAISRTNARHFLESLLYWVGYVGYAGTVALLDNSRVTLRQNPRDGLRFYSRSAVMDHYELLRELIDSTDRLSGLLMVVVSNNEFLDDDTSRRGYSIYRALQGRIADEVRPRGRANPMSTLVRLADTVIPEQTR